MSNAILEGPRDSGKYRKTLHARAAAANGIKGVTVGDKLV
jgi:hypothetical protein